MCFEDDTKNNLQTIAKIRSGQGTIQFQLMVGSGSTHNPEAGELWGTGRPVMTHHHVRHLGMNVQLAEPAPPLKGASR